MMAGAAEPTASSGLFNKKPIVRLGDQRQSNRLKVGDVGSGKDYVSDVAVSSEQCVRVN